MFQTLRRDAYFLCLPYIATPGPSIAFLAMTGVLAALPHRENNSFRKLITFMLVVTWICLIGAVALDIATINMWVLLLFTSVTMLVYGQMWELEKYRVAAGPFEIFHSDAETDTRLDGHHNDNDNDNDNDDDGE